MSWKLLGFWGLAAAPVQWVSGWRIETVFHHTRLAPVLYYTDAAWCQSSQRELVLAP